MDNEQIERHISFIIEQQAQFSVDIQKLNEAHAKAEGRISRLEGAIVAVVNMIADLTKAQKHTDEKLVELAEGQKRTDEQLAETSAKLAETDERLNIFINVVERHLSGGNGNGQSRA